MKTSALIAIAAMAMGGSCGGGGASTDPGADSPVAGGTDTGESVSEGGGTEDGSLQTLDTGVPASAPTCTSYDSQEQESSPLQTVGALPTLVHSLYWELPSGYTYAAAFSGSAGQPAHHEGHDLVHADSSVADVPVYASSSGTVSYVRTGCPQSAVFSRNEDLRECGSGWGNHVVVEHAGGLSTRYGHLEPGSILVSAGDSVVPGQRLGAMGNSGRSEVRHLHFEPGSHAAGMDPCLPAQSFDLVHDPSGIPALQP